MNKPERERQIFFGITYMRNLERERIHKNRRIKLCISGSKREGSEFVSVKATNFSNKF